MDYQTLVDLLWIHLAKAAYMCRIQFYRFQQSWIFVCISISNDERPKITRKTKRQYKVESTRYCTWAQHGVRTYTVYSIHRCRAIDEVCNHTAGMKQMHWFWAFEVWHMRQKLDTTKKIRKKASEQRSELKFLNSNLPTPGSLIRCEQMIFTGANCKYLLNLHEKSIKPSFKKAKNRRKCPNLLNTNSCISWIWTKNCKKKI